MRERGGAADAQQEFFLLPENVPVLRLWGQVQGQWLHGMAGPTGLAWAGVRAHPAVARIPRGRRRRLLAGLAEMEGAWLAERGRIAAQKRNQPC